MADVPILDHPTGAQLLAQLDSLLDPTELLLTQLANAASLLYWSVPDLNWVGFYFRDADRLLLGPFHGKPACTVLPMGEGVCAAAATERRTVHVPDVHAFPGHIACDAASNAEVVVPLMDGETVWAVLDVDSPVRGRFTDDDVALFEGAARILEDRYRAAGGRVFPLDNTR